MWLKKNATNDELIKLTKYPNSVVKVTAFESLYHRKNQEIPRLLIELSEQNETILYQSGCIGFPIQIGEYCFSDIMLYQLPWNIDVKPPQPNGIKREIELSEKEKEIIIENIENIKNKIRDNKRL